MTTDNQFEKPTESAEEVIIQHDYFGFSARERFTFPDNVTWIEFEVMNEGAKAKFQKITQRDLTISRQTGDARMRTDPAEERHALIKESVKAWNLVRGPESRPVPCDVHGVSDFLKYANPKLIEDLETAIRKANPWLLGEMSVEDIDREIENLNDMRKTAVERESEKGVSSSK